MLKHLSGSYFHSNPHLYYSLKCKSNTKHNIKLISSPTVIFSWAQTFVGEISFKWIALVICKLDFYWTWKLHNYVCGFCLHGLLCKVKSVSDMTVIRWGLLLHMPADRGLQSVAGLAVIPGRNTQQPRQFNYSLLCSLILRPDKKPGINVCRNIRSNIVVNFKSGVRSALFSVMLMVFNPQRNNKLDI